MTTESTITVEKFMERALYDPEHGYYSRRITGVGRHGDFTTAPMLSGAPAKAVATWAAEAMKACGTRNLIEIGPGEGQLAAAIMKHLPWHLRHRVRLHLVERSAPLAAAQKRLLGSRARWHQTPAEALAACAGEAVIYSNELVDAFPARCFQKTPEGWRELAVATDPAGRVDESLMDAAPLPASSAFRDDHPQHQRVEVHDSYRRWLVDWLPLWKAGRMLTIDYGALSENLYHRQPRGTLRAYLMQQRLEGKQIYQNPGRQDMTADVNFTDIMDWSKTWTHGTTLRPFSEFISPTIDPRNPVDHALANHSGAGGAFMVLDQACRPPEAR